jgi:hypothetical protein
MLHPRFAPHDEECDGQDQTDHEQNPRDLTDDGRDSRKSRQARNQGHDQTDYCPVHHDVSPLQVSGCFSLIDP